MKLQGVVLELTEQQVDQIAARVAERFEAPSRASELLNVEEAAAYLRCQPKRLYDLCYQGRIECLKDGRRTLFAKPELDAYLEARGD